MPYRLVLLVAALGLTAVRAQTDWPIYGHDPGARRFSPLTQINPANVHRLQRAWTFHTGKPGSEAIPLVVGGVMYAAAANGIFAIEPETGKQIWHYEATQVALRGLAWWPGDKLTHARVFAGVKGGMIAIDVTTGRPAPGFGVEGLLDLKKGVLGDLPDARIALE
jgi:quinoprotein glucose dehydrogenase